MDATPKCQAMRRCQDSKDLHDAGDAHHAREAQQGRDGHGLGESDATHMVSACLRQILLDRQDAESSS